MVQRIRLVIHGGLIDHEDGEESRQPRREALQQILDAGYKVLESQDALQAVIQTCALLEDNPLFNAGTGATIQRDGQFRLSSGLMDGHRQSFSGVINGRLIKNPIYLAEKLQQFEDRLLDSTGVEIQARNLGLDVYDPATPELVNRWAEFRFTPRFTRSHGTVGAVAVDAQGKLAAATSTGGRFMAGAGRVSDSCTPAGNYANEACAVSCTGHGEDILDEALATRIVLRVTDGLSLDVAVERSFHEAKERSRDFAAICVDCDGNAHCAETIGLLVAAYRNDAGAFTTTL
jgi:L-asparaginase